MERILLREVVVARKSSKKRKKARAKKAEKLQRKLGGKEPDNVIRFPDNYSGLAGGGSVLDLDSGEYVSVAIQDSR